jgi:YHS domain-containing protein
MRTQNMAVLGVVVAGVLLGTLAAFAEEASAPAITAPSPAVVGQPQTTCPVMGAPINKKFYTDYQGQRVYFCCNMCPGIFAKNPEKYMKILRDAGIALEKTSGTAAP